MIFKMSLFKNLTIKTYPKIATKLGNCILQLHSLVNFRITEYFLKNWITTFTNVKLQFSNYQYTIQIQYKIYDTKINSHLFLTFQM